MYAHMYTKSCTKQSLSSVLHAGNPYDFSYSFMKFISYQLISYFLFQNEKDVVLLNCLV